MKGLIVASVVFVGIVYGLLRPDQFSDAVEMMNATADSIRSRFSKHVLHLG